MASLIILSSQKEDLEFLQNQSVENFCKLAWNFLSKGTNMKLYQSVSQKLQIEVNQVQAGVEGLAYLFFEAARNEISKENFKNAVLSLCLPSTMFETIYSEYLNQKEILDLVLPQIGFEHLQFKDLEWRLEAQVSSRSLKNQILPRVIMKLDLDKGGQRESVCLQSDIPNMIHMNRLLQQALHASKSHHSGRILRAVT